MYRSKSKPVNPAPWMRGDDRVGTLIYDANGNPVAVANTPRLARRIVDAVNAQADRGPENEDEASDY